MVCDDVSLGDHAFYKVRAGIQVVPDDKKCGGDPVLFQGIQDGWGVPVLVSGIEREVDDFFAGEIGIPGIVLFQFIRRGICNGRTAFLLKRKPPVPVGGGRDGRGDLCGKSAEDVGEW